MKKAVAAAVIAATAVVGTVGLAGPANAYMGPDERDCTRTEYQSIYRGQSLNQTYRIMGGDGKTLARSGGLRYVKWGSGLYNGWCYAIVDTRSWTVQSREGYIA